MPAPVPVCRKTPVQARRSRALALAGGLCAFAARGRLSPLAVSRCLRVPGTAPASAESSAPRGRRRALSRRGGRRPPHRHLCPHETSSPPGPLCLTATAPLSLCPGTDGRRDPCPPCSGGREWGVELWVGPRGGTFRPRPAPGVCWPSWSSSAGGHFPPAPPSPRGRPSSLHGACLRVPPSPFSEDTRQMEPGPP